MRISDWSSDVCSSDLGGSHRDARAVRLVLAGSRHHIRNTGVGARAGCLGGQPKALEQQGVDGDEEARPGHREGGDLGSESEPEGRSEEHTSELQSLMRTSYAVLCLKK